MGVIQAIQAGLPGLLGVSIRVSVVICLVLLVRALWQRRGGCHLDHLAVGPGAGADLDSHLAVESAEFVQSVEACSTGVKAIGR